MTNELSLTRGMFEQAKSAPSAAVLQAQAQENGIILTAEDAAIYYAQLHPEIGALSDEELDNVAGGCGSDSPPPAKCNFCDGTKFRRGPVVKGHPSRWACKKCGMFA